MKAPKKRNTWVRKTSRVEVKVSRNRDDKNLEEKRVGTVRSYEEILQRKYPPEEVRLGKKKEAGRSLKKSSSGGEALRSSNRESRRGGSKPRADQEKTRKGYGKKKAEQQLRKERSSRS